MELLKNSLGANISSSSNGFLPSPVNKTNMDISNLLSKDFCYKEYTYPGVDERTDTIEVAKGEGFYFLYCWQGAVQISYNNGRKTNIKSFESAIIFNQNGKVINLTFQEKAAYHFCIIGMTPSLSIQNSFYSKCREAFFKHLPANSYLFVGRAYLKLLEKTNNLSQIVKTNISSEMIMEGLMYQIIGLKMEQLINDMNSEKVDYGSLTNAEFKRVLAVSDCIRANPAKEYSVEFLCRETGLSPSKLQEGFKKVYNRTVIDFIRNVRLEKSVDLIKNTDLNISEIVYSIGLTSRSYFSKIFKKKYKCSPKNFQYQQIAELVVS